jgi:hypothetical protein
MLEKILGYFLKAQMGLAHTWGVKRVFYRLTEMTRRVI